MSQDIITYSQLYNRDEPHIKYYDPNALYNQRAFTLYAGEEVLLLISGSGFGIEDETIYQLEPKGNGSGKFVLESKTTDRQLCMLVQNRSTTKSTHVARKTSLAALLEMPRIKSYLCHVSLKHMAERRLETSMRAGDGSVKNHHGCHIHGGDHSAAAAAAAAGGEDNETEPTTRHTSLRAFNAPFASPVSDAFLPPYPSV